MKSMFIFSCYLNKTVFIFHNFIQIWLLIFSYLFEQNNKNRNMQLVF